MADIARTKQGQRLGELLLDADIVTKRQLAKACQAQVKGDKRKIGEILVELGFLSNMKDSKLLQEEKYRKKLLESLAQVVDNYFKKREDSNY